MRTGDKEQEMGEAIDKYIKADRNARLIEREGRSIECCSTPLVSPSLETRARHEKLLVFPRRARHATGTAQSNATSRSQMRLKVPRFALSSLSLLLFPSSLRLFLFPLASEI